jgi:hypothetical protein
MCSKDARMFHRLDFEPAYGAEIDPEFPAGGEWPCPVFGFDRDGHCVGEEFVSRWGAPLVVHVVPAGRREWIGMFPAGGLGGIDGVFAGPGPTQMCAVVDGSAYLVSVDMPTAGAVIAHDQVGQVVSVPGAQLLLLIRFIDIVAVGPDGIAWHSPRLAVDDLRVDHADTSAIHCTADMLGHSQTPIVVDPATGLVAAGPRLEGPPWN